MGTLIRAGRYECVLQLEDDQEVVLMRHALVSMEEKEDGLLSGAIVFVVLWCWTNKFGVIISTPFTIMRFEARQMFFRKKFVRMVCDSQSPGSRFFHH